MVVLKRGAKKIAEIFDKITVSETPDGIVFESNNFFLRYVDNNMPSSTKRQMEIMVDRLKEQNVVINLNNYSRPVSVNKI